MARLARLDDERAAAPHDARPRYARVLTALAHPVRADLLDAFDGSAATPSELAMRIRQPLPHVVHHMRRLVELGCVEVIERRVKNGTVHRFYRRIENPWFEHEDFEPFGATPRKRLVETTIRYVLEDLDRAARSGWLGGGDDAGLEHRTIELDDEGWRELDERIGEFVADVQRIVERASARLDVVPSARARHAFPLLLKFRSRRSPPAARADAEVGR